MKKRSKLLCGLLAGLPALYLFSIAPGRRSLPLMDRLKKYDYAHRGLHNNLWKIPKIPWQPLKRPLIIITELSWMSI